VVFVARNKRFQKLLMTIKPQQKLLSERYNPFQIMEHRVAAC
jgi:hypothetical protein